MHKNNYSNLIFGTMRLGVWGANFSAEQILLLIEACLERGITTFDLADIYGNYTTEADFGQALQLKPSLRDQIQLITKCGIKFVCENKPDYRIKSYDSSKTHIIASVENSLKQLKTDYIDLLLLHRPDFLMNPDEVATAFNQLKDQGKVKEFGVSNFTASQFEMLNNRFPLVTNQVEISILKLDTFTDGTLDQCLKHQLRPMAWSPFAGGQIFQTSEQENIQNIQTIGTRLAQKYEVALDQIILAWLLKHPAGIQPILGTSKLKRIQAAVDASTVEMTKEEWYELWQASTGTEIA